MKRFLILPILLLSLAGCATTVTVPTTGILTADQVTIAQKPLIAVGAMLQATPGTLQVLLDAGKITKDDYNKVVPIYNKVLAGWKVAVQALTVGASAASYSAAYDAFMADKTDLDALIAQIKGVRP
jgi:type IV secretory pathway VirB6-like protein